MTTTRLLMLAVLTIRLTLAEDSGDELLAATRKGDTAKVKALLDSGVSANYKSPYGQTALFFACDRGYTEIAKLLIDRGADVNVEDNFYHASALSWAAQKNHPDLVRLLLEHGAKSPGDVLQMGAQMGNAEYVKIALDVGKGNIDKTSMSKALDAANKGKKPEIADMLKAAGAVPLEPVKFIELDPATLANYTGTYTGGRGGTEFEMTFAVKGTSLSGSMIGQPALTYSPISKTHFKSVEFQGVDIEFNEGGFILTQGSQNIEFKKKAVTK